MLLSTTLRRSLELALLLFIPNVLGAPIPATLSNLEGTTETGNVTVSIFHINDIHGHLDGFTPVECCEDGSERCLGGYARIQHTMKQARSELNNSLFFNCGDEYQVSSSPSIAWILEDIMLRRSGNFLLPRLDGWRNYCRNNQ